MSNIIDNVFSNLNEELKEVGVDSLNKVEHDEIMVKPGSDEINPPVPKPLLSKLKQDRLRERELKQNRILKRNAEKKLGAAAARNNKTAKKRKGMNMKTVKWMEAKNLAMDVWKCLDTFEQVASSAIMLINRPDIEVDQRSKDEINSKSSVYAKDIQAFRDKWLEITADMNGKEDKVLLDEFPTFYLIYDQLLNLQSDAMNLLADPAEYITGMVQAICDEVNRQIAEASGNTQAEPTVAESVEMKDE